MIVVQTSPSSDDYQITIGCNVFGGHYRNNVAGLMAGGKETTLGYRPGVTYEACLSAFSLRVRCLLVTIFNARHVRLFRATWLPLSFTPPCNRICFSKLLLRRNCVLLAQEYGVKLNADSGKSVRGFSRIVLLVKHFNCFNHIIGKFMYFRYLLIC
jgi:hypothetical protein